MWATRLSIPVLPPAFADPTVQTIPSAAKGTLLGL